MNLQAKKLNEVLKKSVVYSVLSSKGEDIFYPKEGILGQTAEAKGSSINATIGLGLEDNGEPMFLPSIASKLNMDPKDVFPQSFSYGENKLRELWLKKMDVDTRTSLSVVTSGLTHALSVLGYLFVNENDSIITPDLFWGNYGLIFENGCGASLNTFPLFAGDKFNIVGLREKLLSKGAKKIVLLNFPNNPTGYTVTKSEGEEIITVIKEAASAGKKLIVICDDAYAGLVYKEGILEGSLFSSLANIDKNVLAVKVDGATKELFSWGLRVGFVTFGCKGINSEVYDALEAKCAGTVRGVISNVSHLSQSLVLGALKSKNLEKERDKKYQLLKKRFMEVERVLLDEKYASCFTALPFNSGYFLCVRLKEGLDPEKIRQKLLKDFSTGVIATKGLLRIAFSSIATAQIEELFENLYGACADSV
jgi:aspartate/methionine/tyrosine aminotransferase